ncbi:MAG: glycerol-3-phosphate 1-O-acyltransferase PlsY [Alphaproteobacteria bacterium]|nr:glycerol-3-phosphate 1-O-acyltransferase PlsY [Alphaproteobacteria bacterium]
MFDAFMILVAYMLGSIPFGILITRIGGAGDIRQIGSGNIGATNVLRTGRKELAFLTLFLDMMKGTLAVLLATLYAPHIQLYAALFVLLGHMFPIWLKFKGGKGVATALGIFIALAPPVALMAALVWLASAFLVRISSASALAAVASAPVFVWIFYPDINLLSLTILVVLLIFFSHRSNIDRLLTGTEPRIGKGKTPSKKEKHETQDA